MFGLEDTSDWFWQIIARADRDREKLTSILEQLPREELIRFKYEFESASYLVRGDVWAKPKVTESDVDIMSRWLVSQGRDYFATVLRNAQKIPEIETIDESEELSGVADHIFLMRFGEFLPVPEGAYWFFVSDPWIDKIEDPEHESFLGDVIEGLAIHKEYVRRLSRKTDKSGNE